MQKQKKFAKQKITSSNTFDMYAEHISQRSYTGK